MDPRPLRLGEHTKAATNQLALPESTRRYLDASIRENVESSFAYYKMTKHYPKSLIALQNQTDRWKIPLFAIADEQRRRRLASGK